MLPLLLLIRVREANLAKLFAKQITFFMEQKMLPLIRVREANLVNELCSFWYFRKFRYAVR